MSTTTMRQKDIRPAATEIEYKGFKFLVTEQPSDQTIYTYIQVRKHLTTPEVIVRHILSLSGLPSPFKNRTLRTGSDIGERLICVAIKPSRRHPSFVAILAAATSITDKKTLWGYLSANR